MRLFTHLVFDQIVRGIETAFSPPEFNDSLGKAAKLVYEVEVEESGGTSPTTAWRDARRNVAVRAGSDLGHRMVRVGSSRLSTPAPSGLAFGLLLHTVGCAEPELWEPEATVCGRYTVPETGPSAGLDAPTWFEFWPDSPATAACGSGDTGEADTASVPPWDESYADPIEVAFPDEEGYFSVTLEAQSAYTVRYRPGTRNDPVQECTAVAGTASACTRLELP